MDDIRKVLVVEDEPAVRELLALKVQEGLKGVERVYRAASLQQARTVLEAEDIDLALIDINLPDGKGLALLPTYSAPPFNICCIVLTAHDDDDYVFQSLRQGARGYLLKNEPIDSIVAQLQGIVNGVPPLSPSISRKILHFFNKPVETPQQAVLTKREEEVLALLAKGLNRSEIAEVLSLSPHTIAGYTKTIYQKLNISSRVEATHAAIKLGLS